MFGQGLANYRIASEIPEPDDFFVYEIGIEEILVVRQRYDH